MKIIIANTNPILDTIEHKCIEVFNAKIIKTKKQLLSLASRKTKPDFIFFLHWSELIPEEIFSNINCIVFHMTDLPYGRGGSPLQNLIIRGHTSTMISAIKVEQGIDTGPIYLKRPLSLSGNAQEIFIKAGKIIFKMIHEIISRNPKPIQQKGKVVFFKRRKPVESNISLLCDIEQIFDYIRMLDAKGYPHAFIETSNFRMEFTGALLNKNKSITANVKITKK